MAPTLDLLEAESTGGTPFKCKTIERVEKFNKDPESGLLLNKTGGDELDSFDWFEAWYPVYVDEDMDKTKPMPMKILEQNIVVWWDANATH